MKYDPATSFIRVATATPVVHLGDIDKNISEILMLYRKAVTQHASVVVFPELCITGYSIGDLHHSREIINSALRALEPLAHATVHTQTAMIVGLPFRFNNALYNCTALLAQGEVKGFVPKINLPNYKEFYEKRWFQPWKGEVCTAHYSGKDVPFGSLLFDIGGVRIGIEICEDVWVPEQPALDLVRRGAHIICNPSASPEMVTKSQYRKQLLSSTSARLACAYVYSGADQSESTMDTVMSGHSLIYELGRLRAERQPFSDNANRLTVTDIDIDHIVNERLHDNNFPNIPSNVVSCNLTRTIPELMQIVDPKPFIPKGSDHEITERLNDILTIQSYGLKKRMESSGSSKVVLGLSGGLDSTLALLVAMRTAALLNQSPKECILTLTMPAQASSGRTQTNAQKLATLLGVENRLIPIQDLAAQQLDAMNHTNHNQDTTYENTQARLRTALLFNTANTEHAIVLGTGDLSEIALGWCTFNGDHMSAYNVNSSIPKSLVRDLVRHESNACSKNVRTILLDILDTPVSPELTTNGTEEVSQKTEDIVGPYELHDFFLFHFVRWMEPPEKILYLASIAFSGTYSPAIIKKWLMVFMDRFYRNQWKRSVMPDGPKVGSVSLSPRGDWRMPSDIDRYVFSDSIKA